MWNHIQTRFINEKMYINNYQQECGIMFTTFFFYIASGKVVIPSFATTLLMYKKESASLV